MPTPFLHCYPDPASLLAGTRVKFSDPLQCPPWGDLGRLGRRLPRLPRELRTALVSTSSFFTCIFSSPCEFSARNRLSILSSARNPGPDSQPAGLVRSRPSSGLPRRQGRPRGLKLRGLRVRGQFHWDPSHETWFRDVSLSVGNQRMEDLSHFLSQSLFTFQMHKHK